MLKKRYSKPGSSPATLTPHASKGAAAHEDIHVIHYNSETLTEQSHEHPKDLAAFESGVTWIDIGDLSDVETLRVLGERFHIHPLALEDVLNIGQRPKIEFTKDYIFICIHMVYHRDDDVLVGEQVSLFLGRNFVITVQEDRKHDTFEPVRDRLRAGRGMIRSSGADYLAYALLDSVIDHYFPVIETLSTEMEELEDRMLETSSRSMVRDLHDHRRNLTHIRRLIWPMRDVVNALLHDGTEFVTSQTRLFLRDCYDHTIQLMDLVESLRELTASVMELYHSSVGLRTNEIMRVLTVITSVFIPLTFVVGVYGMNFAPVNDAGEKMALNMPELYHPLGYVGIMSVMLIIAIVQLIVFRRLKWL